mmetsp:Transcript_16364/g.44388  ORF Transcript_16364/g.44388 Transcript_16364/m.44388 type:complete len:214 (+) Transcript_16364:628-1269(+)
MAAFRHVMRGIKDDTTRHSAILQALEADHVPKMLIPNIVPRASFLLPHFGCRTDWLPGCELSWRRRPSRPLRVQRLTCLGQNSGLSSTPLSHLRPFFGFPALPGVDRLRRPLCLSPFHTKEIFIGCFCAHEQIRVLQRRPNHPRVLCHQRLLCMHVPPEALSVKHSHRLVPRHVSCFDENTVRIVQRGKVYIGVFPSDLRVEELTLSTLCKIS